MMSGGVAIVEQRRFVRPLAERFRDVAGAGRGVRADHRGRRGDGRVAHRRAAPEGRRPGGRS
nr:hypothetical protein GCM10017588_56810 [Microbispora rosea subsp. aerata]